MTKWLVIIWIVVTLALLLVYANRALVERSYLVTTLFSGKRQYRTFARMEALFPTATVQAPAHPQPWPHGETIELPLDFPFNGGRMNTHAFLASTDTTALLVLENGEIRHEQYWLSGGPNVRWISWSMAKSYISALIGIAVEEGAIQSIDDPMTKYAPELAGSAYDGVSIKDVLQMSSGARWSEDYANPNSDVMRFGRIFALGGSLDAFVASIPREYTPGTLLRYNSADTQALGLVLVRATGRNLSDYMYEKLWAPMGAESEAHWLLDSKGRAMTAGGLTATARDYARLGELYRNGGRWADRQIVPEDWVRASTRADAPRLEPTAERVGYGYQWWLADGDDGEFLALGIYNQMIYVNPARGVTIVKLGANPAYKSDEGERESLALLREIAAKLKPRS